MQRWPQVDYETRDVEEVPGEDEQPTVAKRLNESDPDLGDRKRVFGVFVHYADCLKLDFQVSISPTFYEQLLCQNPFAKKL